MWHEKLKLWICGVRRTPPYYWTVWPQRDPYKRKRISGLEKHRIINAEKISVFSFNAFSRRGQLECILRNWELKSSCWNYWFTTLKRLSASLLKFKFIPGARATKKLESWIVSKVQIRCCNIWKIWHQLPWFRVNYRPLWWIIEINSTQPHSFFSKLYATTANGLESNRALT
jgi:hypothetical protein